MTKIRDSKRNRGGGGGTASRSQSPASRDRDRSNQQDGLRSLVQRRMLTDVFDATTEKFPGWKVLIVDQISMRVVSAAIGMYDIMEKKVTLVEALEKKRAPFPDMAAIYLLSPSKESIALLIEDFEDKSKFLYGNSVFLYFLGRIPDRQLELIKKCPLLLKKLKALTELNIDFLAKEERAFTLDMPKHFSQYYLRSGTTPIELDLADRLVTVCATLNEYPHIRYKQTSAIGNSLASIFHLKMNEFVSANPKWWYYGQGTENKDAPKQANERERGTLLVLDRAYDCLSPLMHDFTYQAMVNDLLDVVDDRLTYKSETEDEGGTEEKDVLLNEKDELWVELRSQHIAAVIETLTERIKEIVNSSTGSALSQTTGKQMSLSQMAAAIKALPEYKEVMSKLSQHMHISHKCMDKFRTGDLLDLGEVEQTLATGVTEDGVTPKINEMMDRVEHELLRMKDQRARLRLILIATISQGGLRSQDRDRFLRAAELSRRDVQTLNSLETLGLTIFASGGEDKKSIASMFKSSAGGPRIASAAVSEDDSEYAGCRYSPPLKGILMELINNTLSLQDFPSVLPMPEAASSSGTAPSARGRRKGGTSVRESLRSKGNAGPSPRWSRGGAAPNKPGGDNKIVFTGPRTLVFMVGGLCYPELRVAREIMQKEGREVIMGSTNFNNPHTFLDDLESLSSSDIV